MSDLLTSIDHCPVCRYSVTSASNCPDDIVRDGGLRYLRPMADALNLDLPELANQIGAYQCSNCHAHFLNPWFSPQARNQIFLSGHPVHNMGWSNFFERIASKDKPSLPMKHAALIDVIESKIGKIHSYAEIGCPFMGLLLESVQPHVIKDWLRLGSSFGAMPKASYKQLPQAAADYMTVAGWASNLAKVASRLRIRKRNLFQRELSYPPSTQSSLQDRYFISHPSSQGWGLNCASYGESCTSVAHTTLGAKVVTLSSLESVEDQFLDLVGIFLMLDHQDSPLELLKICLSKSKGVLILTHGGPFSPQHHIGLGEEFFTHLPNLIAGTRVDRIGNKESDAMFLVYHNR